MSECARHHVTLPYWRGLVMFAAYPANCNRVMLFLYCEAHAIQYREQHIFLTRLISIIILKNI